MEELERSIRTRTYDPVTRSTHYTLANGRRITISDEFAIDNGVDALRYMVQALAQGGLLKGEKEQHEGGCHMYYDGGNTAESIEKIQMIAPYELIREWVSHQGLRKFGVYDSNHHEVAKYWLDVMKAKGYVSKRLQRLKFHIRTSDIAIKRADNALHGQIQVTRMLKEIIAND